MLYCKIRYNCLIYILYYYYKRLVVVFGRVGAYTLCTPFVQYISQVNHIFWCQFLTSY